MNGVIVLDKPAGYTSFDAVAIMRGLAKEKKIGHTGTLDPMATGVLPLLLGRAAKAADLLPDTDKAYTAGFQLGLRYDTGDITGTVVETSSTPVSHETLEQALARFRGDILQVPPMYSAVSVGGQRLYKLARQGIEVERQPRPIHIGHLELLDYDEPTRQGSLRVVCSKGTYIRVLIEDIAKAANTCGAMTALRRTAACGFTQSDSHTLDDLRRLASEGGLHIVLRPTDSLFHGYPAVYVSQAQAARFYNGGGLDMARLRLPGITITDGQRIRVYGPGERFLGLAAAQLEKKQIGFLKLFTETN